MPEQAAVLSLENAQLAQLTSPQLSVWGPSRLSGRRLGRSASVELIRLNEDTPAAPKERGQSDFNCRGSTDVKA